MSSHISAGQIRARRAKLAVAAVVAAASIGAGTTAAVSVASAPATTHPVSHSVADGPWCCIPALLPQGVTVVVTMG